MAAFTISTIQCTPDFTTSNRSASRIFAVPNTVLYSSLTPPVPEGVDGSAQCCTFLMPTAAGTPVPISVSGVASLLTSTRSFVLQGIWNTRVVFQTGALASPNTANFTVPINQLLFVGNPPLFPCRLPGNWAWAIGPPGGRFKTLKEAKITALTNRRTHDTICTSSVRDNVCLGWPSRRTFEPSSRYTCTTRFRRCLPR